jgi:hypothetical protein
VVSICSSLRSMRSTRIGTEAMTWFGLGFSVLIALLCWSWYRAGYERGITVLEREIRDEGIPR